MTLTPWARGRCLVWDATIVHRLAASYSTTANLDGAAVANAAEARKRVKYHELAEAYLIQPLAFETHGGIGETTWIFLRRLGSLIADHSGDEKAFLRLRQRIAVAIQMGNATCVKESVNAQVDSFNS